MAHSRQPLPDPLTSARSATVAHLRRLHERKGRQQSGTFLAEGPDCVRAALDHGDVIQVLAVPDHPLVPVAQAAGVRVVPALARVVDAASDAKSSQGVLAECRIPAVSLADVVGRSGPVVIADRIADPGNIGTIVRTAEAVSAAGVITTQGSVDPWNPKSVRASTGSIMRLPVAGVTNSDAHDLVATVRETGRVVVALTGSSPLDVFTLLDREQHAPSQWAWLVGSEAHGVANDLADVADHRAALPMAPAVESLNAAIAVAVCLYAAQQVDVTRGRN